MNKGCRQVLNTLRIAEKLLSAQEIHDRLRLSHDKPPSLTTVYRALDTLVKDGEICILNPLESERRYSITKKEKHLHHIICKSCYITLPISHCSLEESVSTTAREHGFKLQSHVVEFYGTCSACSKSDDETFEITEERRLSVVSS